MRMFMSQCIPHTVTTFISSTFHSSSRNIFNVFSNDVVPDRDSNLSPPRRLSTDIKMKIDKIKSSCDSNEGPKVRASITVFFLYNFQYKIGGKLSLIRCHTWFSVRQRTGSNPADIDMLRSHNGKFFTFLINLNNFLSALIKLFFYHGYLRTLNNNLRKKQNISLSFLCLYIYLYFL